MKLYNLYVAELITPFEFTMHTECSSSRTTVVEKIGFNRYHELDSSIELAECQGLGVSRLENLRPLSDYYNIFGFKKKNDHLDKEKVHQLVKDFKREGLL